MKVIYRIKTKTSKTYYKFCLFDVDKATLSFGNTINACKEERIFPKPNEETLQQTGYGLQLLRKKYKRVRVVK